MLFKAQLSHIDCR